MNPLHADTTPRDTFETTRATLEQLKRDRLDAVAREHDRSALRALKYALRDVHAAYATRLPLFELPDFARAACLLHAWSACGIDVVLTPRYEGGMLRIDAAVTDRHTDTTPDT